ncbi:endonuclease domain-containing protein [Faecalibacterium prausnitzii]|jgi:very-short-patch-repair endonuclease|nr:endonuclease domain-containing protein [Faecalibacterium prausnitzii]
MKLDIVPKNHGMLPQARALRRNMTPQEAKLWYQFLRNYPVKIYKQRIIESFIVDFYCSKAQLVIEVDGAQHFSEQGQTYDRERSAILAQYHLQVLRFSNAEVDFHFDSVCEKIHQTIQSRL